MRTRALALATTVLLGVRSLEGQSYVTAKDTVHHVLEIPSGYRADFDKGLAEIRELQRQGNLLEAQAQAKVLLTALIESDSRLAPHLSTAAQPLNLVWSTNSDDGTPVLAQLVVYSRPRTEHLRELPGLEGKRSLRDVYLQRYDSETAEAQPGHFLSAYLSTPKPSAAAPGLADFVARAPIVAFAARSLGSAGTLGATPAASVKASSVPLSIFTADAIDRLAKTVHLPVAAPPKKHWLGITINYFDLPDASADLVGKYWVWNPQTAATIDATAKKVEAKVRLREGLFSPCARSVSSSIYSELIKAQTTQACTVPTPFDRRAANQHDEKCNDALKSAIDRGYESATQAADCTQDPGRWPEAPLRAADAFATALKKRDARGEAALANVPRVRYSFGLLTALMLGRSSLKEETPRVKLNDDGNVVNDALDRQLSAAIINIHPWPYRSTSRRMTLAERFRLFAGPVVSPDFGLTAGVGVGVFRGLGINGGGTLLLSQTLRDEDDLGDPPSNRRNPFKTRGHRLGFVGLSYVFK